MSPQSRYYILFCIRCSIKNKAGIISDGQAYTQNLNLYGKILILI